MGDSLSSLDNQSCFQPIIIQNYDLLFALVYTKIPIDRHFARFLFGVRNREGRLCFVR